MRRAMHDQRLLASAGQPRSDVPGVRERHILEEEVRALLYARKR